MFFFILNNPLFHINIQSKNYKNCSKLENKVAKLQFTKVIENYNLNYLYPYTWKINNSFIYLFFKIT